MQRNIFVIVLTLAAGLLGGFISSSAFNRNNYEVLTTKNLQIVDDIGNIRIRLYSSSGSTYKMCDSGEVDYKENNEANIDLFNNNGSLFSSWSTRYQRLFFHDRDNLNKSLSISPRGLVLNDGNRPRFYISEVNTMDNTLDKYGVEDYTMVFYNKNGNVLWSAP